MTNVKGGAPVPSPTASRARARPAGAWRPSPRPAGCAVSGSSSSVPMAIVRRTRASRVSSQALEGSMAPGAAPPTVAPLPSRITSAGPGITGLISEGTPGARRHRPLLVEAERHGDHHRGRGRERERDRPARASSQRGGTGARRSRAGSAPRRAGPRGAAPPRRARRSGRTGSRRPSRGLQSSAVARELLAQEAHPAVQVHAHQLGGEPGPPPRSRARSCPARVVARGSRGTPRGARDHRQHLLGLAAVRVEDGNLVGQLVVTLAGAEVIGGAVAREGGAPHGSRRGWMPVRRQTAEPLC